MNRSWLSEEGRSLGPSGYKADGSIRALLKNLK